MDNNTLRMDQNALLADNNRIAFIDYIRVVACFLVMLVHSCEGFYAAADSGIASPVSMAPTSDVRFWVSLYDGVFGRFSVPLFMTVSAFLLVPLKPGVTMGGFYKRRFKRILPPMIIFMLLYVFLPPLWGQMTWEQAFNDLKLLPFTFPTMAGHLWFMYPLISLYLIMPVVSPWLEKASARDERIFIGLFALSTTVPWLVRFVSSDLWGCCFWNPYFGMLYYCSGYIGYLVIAHYIRTHVEWSQRKRLWTGVACFVVGGAFTAWSWWIKAEPGVLVDSIMLEWAWEYCTPNVMLTTVGAFLMFTCIRQPKAPRIITATAKLTFGMYLIHIFFLSPVSTAFINGDAAHPLIPVWLAVPCTAVISYVCSAVVVKLTSLIPGGKWIVG